MSKREKVWTFVMAFLMLINIIMHFATCDSNFSYHINNIASVLVAFTLGLWVAEMPRWKGLNDGKTE